METVLKQKKQMIYLPLIVLMFTQIGTSGDNAVLSVATNALISALHASMNDIQLANMVYSLCAGAFMVAGGMLGIIIGWKKNFRIGVILAIIGELMLAISTNVVMFTWGGRLLVGLGASFMIPSVLGLIPGIYSGKERVFAFGAIGAATGIAAAAGKAHRINVIMPFLYESRQHKRSGRESLDCALALKELVNMGVENIITFDAHDPRVQNAIPLRGFETVQPIYQFLKYLLKNETDLQIDSSHMMVISPDEGGTGRAVYFANMLGLDMGMFYKRRDYTQIVNGRNPIVAHEFLGASVEGKDVLIIDDMISSGESVLDVAKELKRRKARKVFVCSTFGLFTGGLNKFDEYYEKGIIDRILTTNLVYQTPSLLERPYYIDVDMSKYIALIIDNLNHDASLSELLTPTKRINKLLAQYRS